MNYGLRVMGITRHRASSGYAHYNTITIQSGQVTGTLTNFPMLVYGTFTQLKTVSNGGYVTNASGFDIIFSSTSASNGSGKLPFEVVNWDGASGAFTAYVQVPSLATGAVIYMMYGNAAITTDQSNTAGTWSNGYLSVYHFGNKLGLYADSCGNANLTNHNGVTQASPAGAVGGWAASYPNNSTSYLGSPAQAALSATKMTLEAWGYTNSVLGGNSQWLFGVTDGASPYSGCYLRNYNSQFDSLAQQTGAAVCRTTSGLWTAGSWHSWACSADSTGANYVSTLYHNGAVPSESQVSGSVNGAFSGSPVAWIGNLEGLIPADQFTWNGYISECRYSNIVRTADWLAASYNNESAPSSFYAVA